MMKLITKNTPSRDREICAKKTLIARVWNRIFGRWRNRNHPHVKALGPHLLRDAGLSDASVAHHQHPWPSETMHHPRN
jgi:hypothetical protein